MKKIAVSLILLLNVTNISAYADCITGYACSINDLKKNDTNSVNAILNENKKKPVIKEQSTYDKDMENKAENQALKSNNTETKERK